MSFCAAVFTRKSNKDTHVRKVRCKRLNRWSYEQISALSIVEASLEGSREINYIEPTLTVRDEADWGRWGSVSKLSV
jgi:hypothetical protein